MTGSIAGIDVHKRVLVIAVAHGLDDSRNAKFECRRFGTCTSELLHVAAWLQQRKVQEVVMESTAQYWKPVWLALEPHFRLYLAQAWSNRAPRGKKTDYRDAKRLVARYAAGELTLSFVPDAEQRQMRSLTRRRVQLTRDRTRIQNQVESLLEETRIKLSSMVTDLFGASGVRILHALARGESDPVKLAALADARVQRSAEELADALTGAMTSIHRRLLAQHLALFEVVEAQLEQLSSMTAELMRRYGDAIGRLVRIPGIRVGAAHQILAEAGPEASAFPSAKQFSSWVGVCPGRDESAGENHSGRSPKGNMYLRRVLCQVAQAAVRTKNSFFEQKFHRLLPRLGYQKAVWAIARRLSLIIWKVLHEAAEYIEYGAATTPQAAQRRLQRLKKELRALGYSDQLIPLNPDSGALPC